MERQIIKINKTTVDNQLADKSIDRTFSELIPKIEIISIDQFFDYYNQLFYDIPRDGNNSHKKLIVQSTEFYGNYKDPKDEIIKGLEKRILELENQLLLGDLNDVELEEKLEKTIKVHLKLEGGSKLGKKKSRSVKRYKVIFTDFEGNKDERVGSYNKYRSESFEFKAKPDFYKIDVYGWVDRRGSKKDWVHQYTSGMVNITNNSPEIIQEDITVSKEKKAH